MALEFPIELEFRNVDFLFLKNALPLLAIRLCIANYFQRFLIYSCRRIFHNPICSSGSTRALKPDHIHHQQDNVLPADQDTSNTAKRPYAFAQVFDVLNKLMKSDKDNTTSDIQLLRKLLSGEHWSYHYSTEESPIITGNTPFSILGSMQLLNTAKFISKMDHGHGLVDRMLFAIPLALKNLAHPLCDAHSVKPRLLGNPKEGNLAIENFEVFPSRAFCFKQVTSK